MKYLLTHGYRSLLDSLKYHPWSAALASCALTGAARLGRHRPERALNLLVRATRGCPSAHRRARLEKRLREWTAQLDLNALDWNAVSSGATDRPDMPKAIIVKPPISAAEKGLLYVTFEDQWLRLLRSGQAPAIARQYDLLLGPTWSPPHDLPLLLATRLWPGKLYTLLSNLDDADTMRHLSDQLIPVPLLASSWVNPAAYAEYLGVRKDFDIVMLANFAPYKRHWLFFHLLRSLPRRCRVLLLGMPLGARTAEVLLDEARIYGVQDRFELHTRLSDGAIAEGLCRSRVSLIFSGQEGSCIAVAESLLADTPVGLFRNARIGSKPFINASTGMLLEQRGLARQVLHFIDTANCYRPREWALANISCQRSHALLNDFLRASARRLGRPWTQDLLPFYQNALPRYLHAEDEARMRPCYEEFVQAYGLRPGALFAAGAPRDSATLPVTRNTSVPCSGC